MKMLTKLNSHLTQSTSRKSSLVGVIQICSTNDIESNFTKINQYITECSQRGARMVCLPENFAFMGATPDENDQMKEFLEGPLIKRYSQIASDNHVWLSLGGFQERIEGITKRYSNHSPFALMI
jgi:deaminated glutathione amidase